MEAERSLLQVLAQVLARRGYALVKTKEPAPVEGEVLRVPLAEGALVVSAAPAKADARSKLELELVAELVQGAVEAEGRGLDPLDDEEVGAPRSPAPSSPPRPVAEWIIGRSPAMLELFALIDRLAGSDSTSVLIQGENGTGKELVAHADPRCRLATPRRAASSSP